MKEIEYEIEVLPEDTEVRGNCMASGDDDFDKECEDKIIADLEAGNVWAWCTVKVTASVGGLEGTDYLGCCSYKDEEDFREGTYYESMKEMAVDELHAKIAEAFRVAGSDESKPIIVALGNAGILFVDNIPAGHELEVRDYDVDDGAEGVMTDDDGDSYECFVYSSPGG